MKARTNFLYLSLIYLLIFIQYPLGIGIVKLVTHQDVGGLITANHLMLWGMVRLVVILPLVFSLIGRLGMDGDDVYLGVSNYKNILKISFWGTFGFTVLGILLYPLFLKQTTLNLAGLLEMVPFFLAFAFSNAFVEEMYFRGVAMASINRYFPFFVANIVQATAFALIHIINPMSSSTILFVVLTFGLGILWGYMTKRFQSLIPAVVLHVVADIFVAASLL